MRAAILKEVKGKTPLRLTVDPREVRKPLLQITEGSTLQGKAELGPGVAKEAKMG